MGNKLRPYTTTGTASAVAVGPQLDSVLYGGMVVDGGDGGAGQVVVTETKSAIVIDAVAVTGSGTYIQSSHYTELVYCNGGIKVNAPASTKVTVFLA